MEELGLTVVIIWTASTISGGDSSSVEGLAWTGLEGLASTVGDGIGVGVGTRIGDDAGVATGVGDGGGKTSTTSTSSLPRAKASLEWGATTSSYRGSESYANLDGIIRGFFATTIFGFSVVILFWLISLSLSAENFMTAKPRNWFG